MKKINSILCGFLALAGMGGMHPEATQAQSSIPAPPGLVSWWRGEGNANDSQGANNGNLLGGVSFAPGMVGQAFSLNGTNGYVRVPASPSLPYGNAPRSVVLWVYTRSSSWLIDRHTIFHSGNSDGLQAFSLDMGLYPGMQFYAWGNDIEFDAGVPAEGWVLAAITYDGSTARVYTQGQLRGSQYYGTLYTGLADIQIGTLDWLGSYFDGLIDEVAIFNRALDQTEIQAIYNAGSAGMTPSNNPPDVLAAAPSIAQIWPPNHKLVPITINGVTDPDGDAVTITITNITNNETGTADAAGIGTATAQVIATRNGKGNGRTYTLSFTATDGKGGTTSGSVTVVVPHNGPNGELCDDDQGDDHGGQGKVEKKDEDKNKKTAAKAPGKRGKPTAVESATWGEVKNSEQ